MKKLFSSFLGILKGLFGGVRIALLILPLALVGLFVFMVLYPDRTFTAIETIKDWFT